MRLGSNVERGTAVLGSVVSLWRYPVKSMMGEELNAAEFTKGGLLGDRAYALVDSSDGEQPKWPNALFQALSLTPSLPILSVFLARHIPCVYQRCLIVWMAFPEAAGNRSQLELLPQERPSREARHDNWETGERLQKMRKPLRPVRCHRWRVRDFLAWISRRPSNPRFSKGRRDEGSGSRSRSNPRAGQRSFAIPSGDSQRQEKTTKRHIWAALKLNSAPSVKREIPLPNEVSLELAWSYSEFFQLFGCNREPFLFLHSFR